MKQCPKCMGLKEVFDGEDYHACNFCKGEGEVDDQKFDSYDPMGEILFNEGMEE